MDSVRSSLRKISYISLVAVVFGSLGVLILTNSHAQTPTASVELENGTLSGLVAINDSSASGGKAVKFATTASVPANYNQIGVIGDSLTKMNGNGSVLISNQLVAKGWRASDVQIMGVYGMQTSVFSGTPANSTGDIINAWRAAGFDPRVWVFALGTNDKFAASPPWDSIRQSEEQEVINDVFAGPQKDYVIYWIGMRFPDANSREQEAVTNMTTLQGFETAYPGKFHACSLIAYYAQREPQVTAATWNSYWVATSGGAATDPHNTDLGYQVLRAPFYAQCVAPEAP